MTAEPFRPWTTNIVDIRVARDLSVTDLDRD